MCVEVGNVIMWVVRWSLFLHGDEMVSLLYCSWSNPCYYICEVVCFYMDGEVVHVIIYRWWAIMNDEIVHDDEMVHIITLW